MPNQTNPNQINPNQINKPSIAWSACSTVNPYCLNSSFAGAEGAEMVDADDPTLESH